MIDGLDVAREKLNSLAATSSPVGEILSVAVTTSWLDDWRQTVPAYVSGEFNRLIKDSGAGGEDKRRLQAGLDSIVGHLRYELTPATQGLVAYSDGGAGVDEVIGLPLRLTNLVAIEPRPYIRPLADAVSLLVPFILAQVSRDDSSLYLVGEWGVAKEDDLSGPWLRSSDRETGEVSIKKYYAAARRDDLVEHHHKEVGASLAHLIDESGAKHVVLCAQHDIAAAFRRTLPAAVAGTVVAEIPWDAASSVGQMIAAARKAADQARQERMIALVGRIQEGLGPEGHGVTGFDDVAGAVALGRLHTLLVDREYRAPGWRCGDCLWVGLTAADKCPLCGSDVSKTADAVGELVRLTVLEHGQIEVGEGVDGLDDLGRVAGLLRYA